MTFSSLPKPLSVQAFSTAHSDQTRIIAPYWSCVWAGVWADQRLLHEATCADNWLDPQTFKPPNNALIPDPKTRQAMLLALVASSVVVRLRLPVSSQTNNGLHSSTSCYLHRHFIILLAGVHSADGPAKQTPTRINSQIIEQTAKDFRQTISSRFISFEYMPF